MIDFTKGIAMTRSDGSVKEGICGYSVCITNNTLTKKNWDMH